MVSPLHTGILQLGLASRRLKIVRTKACVITMYSTQHSHSPSSHIILSTTNNAEMTQIGRRVPTDCMQIVFCFI